jgi:hypothetical protein
MAREKESDSGENKGKGKASATRTKQGLYRYAVPVVVVLLFAIAVLGTNAIDNSISGSMIASIEDECQDKVTALEEENSNLRETLSADKQALIIEKNDLELENVKLKNRAEKLENEVDLYSGILSNLNNEDEQTLTTPYGFKITWDRYFIARTDEESIWSAEIDNTGPSTRSFTLDLKLKSAYNDAFEREPAVIGSLTLKSYNSGMLNVKLTPDDEGYAIFGIYVNNNYVGELIVFSV